MIRVPFFFFFFFAFFSSEAASQTQDITGVIKASGDVFGIHIINKTANKFTITNDEGEFEIPASLNDTIMVSSIQYILKEFVVTDIIIQTKAVTVNLEDNVNVLDQVTVGKILTGDLMSDIENSDAKRDINFYDLGIPGYTGPQKTQSERRLYEAKSGGGLVPLNPFINWLSGRTKRLKEQIEREKTDAAADEAYATYAELLFETDSLDISKHKEFFFFVADDPKFLPLAQLDNELKMLEYLKDKLKVFKLRIETD
ncbi:peptidase associated/transthyretin-like domain-containing protein [Psychroserpens sp. MEBiC05023]